MNQDEQEQSDVSRSDAPREHNLFLAMRSRGRVYVDVKEGGAAIAHFLKRVVRSGVLRQLLPADMRILAVLGEALDHDSLRNEGALVSKINREETCRRAGIKLAIYGRSIHRMIDIGLVKSLGDGKSLAPIQLLPPAKTDDAVYWRKQKSAHTSVCANESEARAPVGATGVQARSYRSTGARAGAHTPVAGTIYPNGINALQCNAEQSGAGTGAGKGEESEKVELLRKEGFDIGSAIALARNPKCTLERLHNAIARANATSNFTVSRQAFITHAITHEYAPPLTAQDRLDFNKPDHVQEAQSIDRENSAAKKAELARIVRDLGRQSRPEIIHRAEQLAALEHAEFWAETWRKLAAGGGWLPAEEHLLRALHTGVPISKALPTETSAEAAIDEAQRLIDLMEMEAAK